MSNVPLKIKMRISEVEKKLCMIIPKVYRDFLLENNNMYFNDGILIFRAVCMNVRSLQIDFVGAVWYNNLNYCIEVII